MGCFSGWLGTAGNINSGVKAGGTSGIKNQSKSFFMQKDKETKVRRPPGSRISSGVHCRGAEWAGPMGW